MTIVQIWLTIACVFGIAVGQVLFKIASNTLNADGLTSMMLGLAGNIPFLIALILYGSMTVFWVWILNSVPLTEAYPYFALSFVFVPLMSYFFLSEPVGYMTFLGSTLIIAGISIIGR